MTRRGTLAGLAATAAMPGAAAARTERDRHFMRMAIEQARQADYPFGAIITRDDVVLAQGRNAGARLHDPTAHGEMVAIRALLAARGPEPLRGATLYSSGEPCPMCMGAILWCGIGRLVYAASIPQLATRMNQIMIRSEEMAKRSFAPIEITGGVLDAEAMALFDGAPHAHP